jgi:hypothetical protein
MEKMKVVRVLDNDIMQRSSTIFDFGAPFRSFSSSSSMQRIFTALSNTHILPTPFHTPTLLPFAGPQVSSTPSTLSDHLLNPRTTNYDAFH